VASFAFNGVVVNGLFGLAVWSGSASFGSFGIKTDDPSFALGLNGQPATTLDGSSGSSTQSSGGTTTTTTTTTSGSGPPGKNRG